MTSFKSLTICHSLKTMVLKGEISIFLLCVVFLDKYEEKCLYFSTRSVQLQLIVFNALKKMSCTSIHIGIKTR